MKKLLAFAIFGLFLSLPTNAQQRALSGGVGPTGNGGGGVGGGGGMGGGGVSANFHTLPNYPRTQFQMIDVSGNGPDFVPSSWTKFDDGLARGEAELAARKKTLADVAAESRHAEKPKAKLIITQDAVGNVVMLRQ